MTTLNETATCAVCGVALPTGTFDRPYQITALALVGVLVEGCRECAARLGPLPLDDERIVELRARLAARDA